MSARGADRKDVMAPHVLWAGGSVYLGTLVGYSSSSNISMPFREGNINPTASLPLYLFLRLVLLEALRIAR